METHAYPQYPAEHPHQATWQGELDRIAARQRIGFDWDGRAANDNQAWPLAKLLRTEGRHDFPRVAARYRQIEATATNPSPLRGTEAGETLPLDHRTYIDRFGNILYKGIRRVDGAFMDLPATRSIVTDDESRVRSARVPKKWTGDVPLIAMIDAKRQLAGLRARLGPLAPFADDAIVHGMTLEEIGRSRGIGNEAGAKGAGRALVFLAIEVLADAFARGGDRLDRYMLE